MVREYKNGEKKFNVGIRAVGLKKANLSFRFDLFVKTSVKTIPNGLHTMSIENHDGNEYKNLLTYDYVPAEELEIVLRNIEIEAYSKEGFETKEIVISLPTRSTYDNSGRYGDHRWFRNDSPKQTTSKGKRY